MRMTTRAVILSATLLAGSWAATGCGGGGGGSSSWSAAPSARTLSLDINLPAAGALYTNGLDILGSARTVVVHVVDPSTVLDIQPPASFASSGAPDQVVQVNVPTAGATLLVCALDAQGREVGTATTTVARGTSSTSVRFVAPTFNDSGTWVAQGPGPLFDNTGEQQQSVSGRIVATATSPLDINRIYAGTASGGVYASTDGGATWAPTTDALPCLTTGALTLDPNDLTHRTLLWGTGESNTNGIAGRGIYRSTDAGSTWSLLPGSAGFAHRGISRVAVQPGNPSVILAGVAYVLGSNYVGTYNTPDGEYGPYLSTDGGVTFSNQLTGLLGAAPNAPCTDVAFSPLNPTTTFFAGVDETLVGSSTGRSGIYRTRDGGSTWTHLTIKDAGGTTLVTNASISRVRFAATSVGSTAYLYALVGGLVDSQGNQPFNGLYLSQDDGDTWVPITSTPGMASQLGGQSSYDACLAIDPSSPTTVYVGGVSVIRLDISSTTTGAATLVNLSPQDAGDTTHPHSDYHDLVALKASSGQTLVRASTDGGLWQLANAAAATLTTPWENLNGTQASGHLETLQLYGIALDPTSHLHAWAGLQDNGSAVFSNNRRWIEVQGGDGGYPRVDPTNPKRVFLSYQLGEIERYLDGGQDVNKAVLIGNGIDANDPREFVTPYVLHPTAQGTMAYGTNLVYESSNYGDSFTPTSGGPLHGSQTITALAYHPTQAGVLYAGLASGEVYARTQAGGSFAATAALPNGTRITALAVDGDDATGRTAYVALARAATLSGSQVYRTTDAGATWTDISAGLPPGPATALYLDPSIAPKRLFVGMEAGGVYARPAAGGSFAPFGRGLLPVEVTGIERSGHVLAISTYGRGMFEIPLTVGEANVIPAVVSGHPPDTP